MRTYRVIFAAFVLVCTVIGWPVPAQAVNGWYGTCAFPVVMSFSPGLSLVLTPTQASLNLSADCTIKTPTGSSSTQAITINGTVGPSPLGCEAGALQGVLTITVANFSGSVATALVNDGGVISLSGVSVGSPGQFAISGVLTPNATPCPSSWSGSFVIEDPDLSTAS